MLKFQWDLLQAAQQNIGVQICEMEYNIFGYPKYGSKQYLVSTNDLQDASRAASMSINLNLDWRSTCRENLDTRKCYWRNAMVRYRIWAYCVSKMRIWPSLAVKLTNNSYISLMQTLVMSMDAIAFTLLQWQHVDVTDRDAPFNAASINASSFNGACDILASFACPWHIRKPVVYRRF